MKSLLRPLLHGAIFAFIPLVAHCVEGQNQKVAENLRAGAENPAGEAKADTGTTNDPSPVKDIKITLKTSKGDIEGTIFASKVPMTAASFLNMASRGYYDGLTFHRVIPDFMIQGGDPTGTGRGGPGYRFADEIDPSLKHDKSGLFSMANAGPGTNGSQFFVTHVPTPWLDGKHAIFGEVTQGQDVVDSIAVGDKIESITIHDSTDALFEDQAANIKKWNSALDSNGYPAK